MGLLRPMILRLEGRRLRESFEQGEVLLASSLGADRAPWSATNRAVYIEPTPTERAEHAQCGPVIGKRIPYEQVLGLHETLDGSKVHRTLICFPRIGGAQFSATANDPFAFGDVVRSHIDDIVVERSSVPYEAGIVTFARRKVTVDGQESWHLEDYDAALEPPSEKFLAWVDSTLEAMNSSGGG